MDANVYWSHSVAYPDENGIAWVGVNGPVGSVAVGGGGWGSINARQGGAGTPDDPPFLPIVATKPDPTNPELWWFGVLSPPVEPPNAPAVQIHCFVVCLEDMP